MNNFYFDSFEDKTIFVKGSNHEISPWDRTKIIAILIKRAKFKKELKLYSSFKLIFF